MKKTLVEKTLHSEKVYTGRFLKIQKDEVLLPDGKTAYREYILHPGAAMVIPLLDNGQVIMERQYRHAVGQVFWEFPAGKIDSGEKSAETAVRELKEETGFTAREWRYLTTIHPVIGYANEKIDLFLAKGLQQTGAQLDAGEFLEMQEVPVAELLPMIRRGEVSDVKTQIGIFWLEKILGAGW
jgi:ADP-ribose pyrophosphatase